MGRFLLFVSITMSLCFAGAQSFKPVVQKGHGEAIKTARFSSDGQYLLTSSRDKSARIWDVSSGKEIRSFLGHEHTVNGTSLVDNKLATSSADGTAAVWNITTGKMLWQSPKAKEFMSSVAFSPDGKLLAIGGLVDSVSIYDGNDFHLIQKLRTNPDKGVGYGVSLAFSPDGSLLAIGEDQRTVKVYRTDDWSLQQELKPEKGYCGGCGTLVTFSADGSLILKHSNGTSFTTYEAATGKKRVEYGVSFRDIAGVSYHASKPYYLIATEDSVHVFSDRNKRVSSFSLEGEINDASFHPEEESIVVALDKVAVVVDLQGNELRRYSGILNQSSTGLNYDLGNYWQHYIAKWVKYKPARLLEDGSVLIGKTGAKARKWSVKNASILMEYIGHEKGILSFERIAEGVIATGGGDGRIIIWDEDSGSIIKSIKAHREPVFDLQLSHDGKQLASCSWDGVISFWDTSTWERDKYIYNESVSAYTLAYTANDAYLVCGLLDKSLQLLEIETGRFVKEFVGHTDNVTSIQVKGDEILTTGWDGRLMRWDLYSGLIKEKATTDDPIFAAKYLGDRIVTAGADRNIHFWDEQLDLISSMDGHEAEINGLELAGTMMMTSDVDGVTKFWDLGKKTELFQHIQIGENDWMVVTPDGYFDATNDAISNIHFVRGMNVYGADQMMEKFFVPGLVEELFSGKWKGASMGNAVDQSPPPLLKLSGVLAEGSVAKLYLKAEDKGGGIEDLKLYHNGKRVSFDSNLQKVRSESDAKIYTIEFPLVGGLNEFTASASSRSSLESNRPSVTLYSESKLPGSTCHILAVGINEYANESLNLNYARPDATSFANKMKEQGAAIYSNVVLHQIYDKDATRESILQKLDALKEQVSINDVFVFYYAGHGSMVDGTFYLVSSSASRLYDNTKIQSYGIAAEEIQSKMLEVKALKQLIIMDACQSGGSVEVLAQRGAPEEKAIAQLSRSSGVHVMAAAGSDQYATEFQSLGHGLFTYALLKGLSGAADGAPKDGKVTIYELKSYLDDQVPELSIKHKGTPQYPHTFSRGQDFPIVIIND